MCPGTPRDLSGTPSSASNLAKELTPSWVRRLLIGTVMRPILPCLVLTFLACGQAAPSYTIGSSGPAGEADAAAALSGDDAAPLEADGGTAGDLSWEAGAPPDDDAGVGTIQIPTDASPAPDAPVDTGFVSDACAAPVGSGDLVIDELMIESVAGTGDYGEWLEITNITDCTLNLNGLHGECPVGSKVHSFDVTADMWIPPLATFVVADSADPAVNHYLPGFVLTWSGQPSDVLRNEGGTVTLTYGETLVASLTWPSLKLTAGVSVELASTCPTSDSADFADWQPAQSSWFPGFRGTPNAPNSDVPCPQ